MQREWWVCDILLQVNHFYTKTWKSGNCHSEIISEIIILPPLEIIFIVQIMLHWATSVKIEKKGKVKYLNILESKCKILPWSQTKLSCQKVMDNTFGCFHGKHSSLKTAYANSTFSQSQLHIFFPKWTSGLLKNTKRWHWAAFFLLYNLSDPMNWISALLVTNQWFTVFWLHLLRLSRN